jgi:hypothetical protein
MKRRRKSNGHQRRAVNDRQSVVDARSRLLRAALKKGVITNDDAKRILDRPQCWYHLNLLAEAGVLKRQGYNTWVPVKRRGRLPAQV